MIWVVIWTPKQCDLRAMDLNRVDLMFVDFFRRHYASNGKLLRICSIMAFLTLVAGGCKKMRDGYVYEIPDGFTGWVTVEFNRSDCPPLARQDGKLILQFKNDGRLRTSSTFEEGWSKDEYYYVGSSHTPRKITDSGPGSLIWGTAIGTQVIGQKERSYLTAFVGSEAQFNKAGNAPDLQ